MRSGIVFLSLALAATAAAARPFADLCKQFEPLRKISDLKYVKPQISIEAKAPGVKPQDVVFTIEAKSGPIRITAAPDGSLALPYDDAKLCAENPNFETNQPPGTVGIDISIDPQIPPVKSLDYRTLDALRREWKEAISRQKFTWRLLAPSAKGYQVDFEPSRGGVAEVRLPSGARTITTNTKGEIRIPFDDDWLAANPMIVFDGVPKRIGLAFD